MAGADRALRELGAIFKDDPVEGPLQEDFDVRMGEATVRRVT